MIDYEKILGIKTCPTCKKNLASAFCEPKNKLIPYYSLYCVGFSDHKNIESFLLNDYDYDFLHFKAAIYNFNNYDIVRRVVFKNEIYGTRLSIVNGKLSYSSFFVGNSFLIKRTKNYILLSNEELVAKINGLRMLK